MSTPTTEAGREWLYLLDGHLPDDLLPGQYVHIAAAILAIEREAAALAEARLAEAYHALSGLRAALEGLRKMADDEDAETRAEMIGLIEQALAALAATPAPPEPLDVVAMAETLRFLYHADEPCDAPDKHRHEHIAIGIVGQYPRIAASHRRAYARAKEEK